MRFGLTPCVQIMFIYILMILIGWYAYRWFRYLQTIDGLSGRYVLITGCDSGFGNMLAKRLDQMGFHVFAGCLTEQGCDKLNKKIPSNIKTIKLDISKTESIQATFKFVKAALPDGIGLWGIVNNAGISGPKGPLDWMDSEDFVSVFRVNTLGMVETNRIFLPLVLKSKGRIINMTSISGRIASVSGPYTASKYAAEAYSDILRRELYKRGVTVHIIEPGAFKTDIADIGCNLKSIEEQFEKQSIETQEYYGEEYLRNYKEMLKGDLKLFASPRVHLVVEAYVHALTSQYPQCRYLVGYDANYIFPLLWSLPEWISDYFICARMKTPLAERS